MLEQFKITFAKYKGGTTGMFYELKNKTVIVYNDLLNILLTNQNKFQNSIILTLAFVEIYGIEQHSLN